MPCRRRLGVWLSSDRAACPGPVTAWLETGARHRHPHQDCPPWRATTLQNWGGDMFVIGIDPHRGSHTAAVLDEGEELLGELRVVADRRQRRRPISARVGDPVSTSSVSSQMPLAGALPNLALRGQERRLRRRRPGLAGGAWRRRPRPGRASVGSPSRLALDKAGTWSFTCHRISSSPSVCHRAVRPACPLRPRRRADSLSAAPDERQCCRSA
jgi:hypothetical protein